MQDDIPITYDEQKSKDIEMRNIDEDSKTNDSGENEPIEEKEWPMTCAKCEQPFYISTKPLNTYEEREVFGCGYKTIRLDKEYICSECLVNILWEEGKSSITLKEIKMSNDIDLRQENGMEISGEEARNKLQSIAEFQKIVRSQMQEGKDYGIIPGTEKPTLLKPGAEKLAKLMGCSDSYEIISEVEDWIKPFFAYKVKCKLISVKTDKLISEGLGEANSYEPKWRYRWIWEKDIPQGIDKDTLVKRSGVSKKTGKPYIQYRLTNEDVCGITNTILKIAKKRALVDAALSAGRLSDLFTQDIEEIAENKGDVIDVEISEAKEEPKKEGITISLTVNQALEAKEGTTINIMGILQNAKERQTKTKKDITDYLISDNSGNNKMTIMRWGHCHEGLKQGQTIIFKDVSISIYNDQKQYMAKEIEII